MPSEGNSCAEYALLCEVVCGKTLYGSVEKSP